MRTHYSINELCEALGLSRSGYYKRKNRTPGRRDRENATLLAQLWSVHTDRHTRCYGSPRMKRELDARGFSFGENRIARLMREAGIEARPRKSFRPRTTQRDPAAHPCANRLADAQAPQQPGEQLVSDITYIPTREGWLYLVIVLDLFTRAILGWNLSRSLHASGTVAAINQARQHAYIQPCAIFHSDRGCQYTSKILRASLPPNWRQSMSAQGNCYDNAFAESCFASIKSELLPDHGLFDSFEHAQRELFDYIETFYNRRRRHSSIGFRSPLQFLELYFQSKTSNLN